MPKISLPFNYVPREYQAPIFKALDEGYKRICIIMHRRAGKDKSLINATARHMFGGVNPRNAPKYGGHYYFLPTYEQGRKIVWEGMGSDGFKFIDHIPKELRERTDGQSMLIEGKNIHDPEKPGSFFRVIGSDRIDSIVGTNPIFNVFSEYSLQDPNAWNFIRPIVAENQGVAIFNYTPRGNNHGKRLYNMAVKDPEQWFTLKLTVEDTKAIPKEVLEKERQEMFELTGSDALFLQEYYCSFDAPVPGAYYGVQMLDAQTSSRITRVPHDPAFPVHVVFDLGVDDSMSAWFVQFVGQGINCIDYLETQGVGLSAFIAKCQEKKAYNFGKWVFPHDINVRELLSGATRLSTVEQLLGAQNVLIAPQIGLSDGIDMARQVIPRCYFDEVNCERGIDCLNSYTKEFVDKNGVYRPTPKHDWASHGADSFRYLAVSYKYIAASMSQDYGGGVIITGSVGDYKLTPVESAPPIARPLA